MIDYLYIYLLAFNLNLPPLFLFAKNQRNATSVASGGSFSADIKDLRKGLSGVEKQPGTEMGHDYSCQVGPRAIVTNTRDDRLYFTSDVARRMHDVVDGVMHHDAHRSRSNVKSDADDGTDDDDSSLSSRSSHSSS